MENPSLFLLELCPGDDQTRWVEIWHDSMSTKLVLAPIGRATAGLIVLNEKDGGVEKLADWIENENPGENATEWAKNMNRHLATLPLYVIWDDGRGVVQEYSPFRDSVRKLVATF